MPNRKPTIMQKRTRRDFLKDASVMAAGVIISGLAACTSQEPTATSPAATIATTEENDDNDEASVIVIGAGMAGLAAANRLTQQGFKTVTVLEARDRIGGRIFTDRSLGVPVDMGASWIHGPKGNPLTELAQAAGAVTYLTDDDSLEVYDAEGDQVNDDILDNAYEWYLELLEEVDGFASPGQSLFEAIQALDEETLLDPLMMYQLSAYAEFDAGAAIEKLGALQWDEDKVYPGADVLFPNGYDAIIDHLAQKLDIRRTHVVESISTSSASGVEVQTTQGPFTADYCICTLPIGVLQAGDVVFNPPLAPSFQEAIDKIGAGHVNKVALRFPERFWDKSVQYIGYTPPRKGQYPYTMNVSKFVPDVNMLMTFGLGSYGLVLEEQSDDQIKNDIMAMMSQIYDEEAVSPDAMLVSRWTQDPYSKCSYSFAGTMTQPSHFEQFVESVSNRLFFAGEHTDVDYRGTVHGAYSSGLRAANDVLSQETS